MRGDPVRIIKRFLAGLALAGAAALVVLAPGLAGATHSLADSATSLTTDSMVWDIVLP